MNHLNLVVGVVCLLNHTICTINSVALHSTALIISQSLIIRHTFVYARVEARSLSILDGLLAIEIGSAAVFP